MKKDPDLSPAVELFKLLAEIDARRRREQGLPTLEEECAAEEAADARRRS